VRVIIRRELNDAISFPHLAHPLGVADEAARVEAGPSAASHRAHFVTTYQLFWMS
jgi:hypothetical protein